MNFFHTAPIGEINIDNDNQNAGCENLINFPLQNSEQKCVLNVADSSHPSLILKISMAKMGSTYSPQQAEVIGRLTGKRIRATDGVLYPLPSSAERRATQAERAKKKAYHAVANDTARLYQALEWLDRDADPATLASVIKGKQGFAQQLSRVLIWLERFAEEFERFEECSTR